MHSRQSLDLTAKQWKLQQALLGSPVVAVGAVFSKTFSLKFFVA
jgi:hypothetical protein